MTDSIVIRRELAEELLAAPFDPSVGVAYAELASAARHAVAWEPLRPLIADLRSEDEHRELRASWQLDQLQAYISDRLSDLGIDVRDERVLYEAICVVALVHECTRNGLENGAVDQAEEVAMRALCRAIGAALGRFAPPAARG